MNGYNFTERVRKVLALARDEAARLDHEYVGTEHILLGLIREGTGAGYDVIKAIVADPGVIVTTIDQVVKRGRATHTGPDIPYTSRAKKVLELALGEVRRMNYSYLGTEHLLLGLLAEERGIAAQVLVSHDVTLDRARAEIAKLLGDNPTPPAAELHHEPHAAGSHEPAARVNDVDPASPYAALLRFYGAFNSRDIERMSEIWSRSGRASRIAPDHELVSGWPDVAETYRQLFAKTARVGIEVNDVSLSALGALALVVSVERWTVERVNASVRIGIDATRIFRHEGAEWRLVHEHASADSLDALRAYHEVMSNA